jgi:iron complex outermembrane recepter protein
MQPNKKRGESMSERLLQAFIALIVGLMVVFGDAFFLYAQESKLDEFTLEEITVTAQKRAESSQKVAIAMEVLSGEQLAETGQNDVSEILKNISNAVINRTDEGMRVTVRGVNEAGGSFNNMRVQTPTVAINFDGAYNTEDSAGQNLFDVERVEVLYGPQSTMYGSNSPGGIVNIITASPKLNKYSASGSVEYAKYDLLNANVTLNAPIISDQLAMRLTGQTSKHGSWVESNPNETKSKNVRLKTLYQPNQDLSIGLTGSYGKASSGGMMGGSVAAFVDQDKIPGGGTAWDYVSDTGGAAPPPPGGGAPAGNPNAADRITKGLSSEITWNTAFASISIVPSYSKSESQDTSNVTDVTVNVGGVSYTVDTVRHSENWTKQKNADIRLTSPADFPIKWILGGTYYNSRRENNDIWSEYPDLNQSGYAWQKTKGIYGNITYPFTDTFRGTVGYRYSWDEMYNNDGRPKPGTTGITGMNYSAPDYKIGMEYDLAQNTMLFANYATSYRVQGMAEQHTVNPAAQNNWRAIPPEKLKAYTIGLKSRFLENKLQVNPSFYYYDYQNREFPVAGDWGRITSGSTVEADYCGKDKNGNAVPGATVNDCPDFDFDGELDYGPMAAGGGPEDPRSKQVGQYEAYGLDVSTNWMITAEDRLDVSLSYMHTKWKDATVHMLWWWIWTDETGKLVEGANFNGMRNTYSPTWAGTIGYEHNFMIGNQGTLTPHVDLQFKSEYKLSLTSDAQVAADPTLGPSMVGWNKQEPYYLVDGNINFVHSSGIWTLNAYVKNATNYAVKTTLAGGGPVGNKIGLNDPRTYGAVFTIKY